MQQAMDHSAHDESTSDSGGPGSFRGLAVRLFLGVLLVTSDGCDSGAKLPDKSSREYRSAVSAFYGGLAALQVGNDLYADKRLSAVTQLAPGEPAGWANWGVLALRQRNFEAAAQRIERARELAPQDGRIYGLLGILESNRGHSAQAIADLRKAVELDPKDLRAAYALAQEIERQGDRNSESEFQQVIEKVLAAQPLNLAALLELSRISAKRGEAGTLKSTVAKIAARSSAWPPEAQEQLSALQAAAAGTDLRAAATRTTVLRNALMRVPEYRQDFSRIKAPPGEEAQPFTHFLRMESPTFSPAPADTALTFAAQHVASAGDGPWSWIGVVYPGGAGVPVVAVANGLQVHLSTGATLPFPGGSSKSAPLPEGVLQLDFNYDFKTDLVLAGAGGVRLFRQENPGTFTDVTAATKLPKSVIDAPYSGAWAADIESDGDLDIVLGSSEGTPLVLRNNGDGRFVDIHPFAGISGLRQFAWFDLDGDGVPDAAIIDASGRLHVFINERQGQFRERAVPDTLATIKAIAVADVNGDGALDLLAIQADGAILRISDKNEGQGWDVAEIARVPDATGFLAGEVRLRVADLDNNGAIDLYLTPVAPATSKSAAGALIWLGNGKGEFTLLDHPAVPAVVLDAADLNGDGRLDLLGLSEEGQAIQAVNQGSKNYHWQVVRPRAAQAFGDQRINPFGVGGEVEIRSGSLLQKQPITGPQLHFGLGEQTRADVVRVIWPNGTVRAEFEVNADQEVVTEQRLKGSCPFLFAFDGKQMTFVKDAVPWASAIGLRINTLGSADIAATEEWYKIGRDELAPHDGYYDLRITAELWEVYYYDYLALMTVDHPIGTEIFVDERFVIPPAKLAYHDRRHTAQDRTRHRRHRTGRHRHRKHSRRQVPRQLRARSVSGCDARPLSGGGPGRRRTRKRSALPDSARLDLSYRLVDQRRDEPRASAGAHIGLSLEVPDGHGGWIVAEPIWAFRPVARRPCSSNLTGVFRAGTPRRVRLRTNLEIYWDAIEWAHGLPETPLKTVRLDPTLADLHYRGYSVIEYARHTGARSARILPDLGDKAALARSDRLLHSVRRCARAAEACGRSLRHHEFRRRDVVALRRTTVTTGGVGARLRHRGRRMDQGWRLQFDVLQDGAAIAVSLQTRVHHATGASRG